MSPDEHYRKAERILEGVAVDVSNGTVNDATLTFSVAVAQVHATLATVPWSA